MNLIPFVGFWMRQRSTLKELMGPETPDHRGLKVFINLAHANLPIIKQYWPELNKNGLLDDFVRTLDDASYQSLTKNEGEEDERTLL